MNVPISWKEIDSEQILDYQQLDVANIKILGAFVAENNESISPVIFYAYDCVGNDFIELYDKQLTIMNKIDQFIDGEPNSFDYEDTATDKPVFHNYFENSLGLFYVSIIKHFLQEGAYTYSIQAFISKNNRLFMGQLTLSEFNEQNITNELNSNTTFNEMLTCLVDL